MNMQFRWYGEDDPISLDRKYTKKVESLNMGTIVKALYKEGFAGYVRPDHGRMIFGETGRPGYGLYDRALGAMYLQGIWEGLHVQTRKGKVAT